MFLIYYVLSSKIKKIKKIKKKKIKKIKKFNIILEGSSLVYFLNLDRSAWYAFILYQNVYKFFN